MTRPSGEPNVKFSIPRWKIKKKNVGGFLVRRKKNLTKKGIKGVSTLPEKTPKKSFKKVKNMQNQLSQPGFFLLPKKKS